MRKLPTYIHHSGKSNPLIRRQKGLKIILSKENKKNRHCIVVKKCKNVIRIFRRRQHIICFITCMIVEKKSRKLRTAIIAPPCKQASGCSRDIFSNACRHCMYIIHIFKTLYNYPLFLLKQCNKLEKKHTHEDQLYLLCHIHVFNSH